MASAARRKTAFAVAGIAVAALAAGGLTGCGGDGDGGNGRVTLRLGHFPNLTHATPIVGVQKGIIERELGSNVKLEVKTFNAGPAAVEALFSGAIDAVYVGPNPAVNAHAKSKGKAIRIVAGAASGGVAFVVKPAITGPADLKGKKIATPQLGNTQDVALRYWLRQKGLRTTKEGGGDVQVLPQENPTAVDAFVTGAIDGAWVPEPYVSRLVRAGGKILVDERDLWPGGRFVITHLAVRTDFLARHKAVVKRLISGSVATNEWINANPEQAQQALSDGIQKLTGKPLDAALTAQAWKTLTFLDDPIAESLRAGARHAEDVGLFEPVNLQGLYDLSLLNQVLKARNAAEVSA